MKSRIILISFIFLIFSGCVGISSSGIFGTGVSIAFDPRSLGTQIDDSVMQKNLTARLIIRDKSYLLSISTKVLDGRIFLTGKVEEPEEKLHLTKLAWETKGVRSVRNDVKIKEDSVKIIMTLTSPNCPVAESLPKDVKDSAMQVDGIEKVDLDLVFEPVWNKDMMSEAAKLELNL